MTATAESLNPGKPRPATRGLTVLHLLAVAAVVSGGCRGLVVVEVGIGPGPAALIGALAITGALVRVRSSPRVYLNNLVNYTWCPLVAGLFFYWAVRAGGGNADEG